MATLAIQRPPAALTYASAAVGGDAYPNSGVEIMHVRNGGGSSITVTRNSQQPCNQGADHDEVTTIPAGEDKMLPAIDPRRFNDGNGRVVVTYSGVTTVTVAVFAP